MLFPPTKEGIEEEIKIQKENLARLQKGQEDNNVLFNLTGRAGFKTLADSFNSSIIYTEDRIDVLERLLANM